MIKEFEINELYDYFANIFQYGVKEGYSYTFIQDQIANSEIVKQLENNSSASFLVNSSLENEIKKIYQTDQYDYDKLSVLMTWVGEAYVRLFFRYHKTFSYLFLYMPIEDMIHRFDIYHEMDWIQLYGYFEELVKKNTLLKLLIKKRDISISKLSIISSISVSTLTHYSLDDTNLYKASYKNIYRLAESLKVDINIFIETIGNYTSSYDKGDEHYLNKLGYLFVSYYSDDKYIFNSSTLRYELDGGSLYVTTAKTIKDIDIRVNDASNNVLIVFVDELEHDKAKEYLYLLDLCPYKKIYIVSQSNIVMISKKTYWMKYIENDIYLLLLERAKEIDIN